jgi:peptidoglycan-N-acetylglucosamine deacetylase
MRLRRVVALLLLIVVLPASAAHRVALTFDDGLDPDAEPRAGAWNDALLVALREAEVTAMVFPSLRHTGGAAGRALMARWSAAGHGVGNHTSRHRSLGAKATTLESFIADVQEADAAFSALARWQPMLRFPYLKEGATVAMRDGMRAWMRAHGYRPAPVSVDTSDWAYNEAYLQVLDRGSDAARQRLIAAYTAHLLDRATYYDRLAHAVQWGESPHVMLLHVSALNAAALPQVVAAFRAQGWRFELPEVAFADPLYRQQPEVLPAGESIVWSLARQAGVTGLRYPAEDDVYERDAIARAVAP